MARHRTNGIADKCAKCGTWVEVEKGTLQGPPWRVFCQSCLPFPKSAVGDKRIELSLAGDGQAALVTLRDRLNGLFGAYREASKGMCQSRKVNGNWQTTCKMDHVAELIELLNGIDGIRVEVGPRLTAALQARASQQAEDLANADDRMAAIEAILAERGQALFNYQRTGIPWLAARISALLADDMGLGKTLQALLAAPADAPILVIAPAVAKGVWKRETNKWRPDLTPFVCKGRKGKNAFR